MFSNWFGNKDNGLSKSDTKSEFRKEFDTLRYDVKATLFSAIQLIENYQPEPSKPEIPSPIEMTTIKSTRTVGPYDDTTPPPLARMPETNNLLTESTFHLTQSVRPLTESFIEVKHTPIPVRPSMPKKNKPQDILRFISPVTKNSFHEVRQATKISKTNSVRFFKYNETPYMSELEAAACHFYRLIAPDYIPTATSHYDEFGKTTGLSSKAVPNFRNIMQDPLTEEDLKNDDIIKGLAIGLTTSYIFEEDDLHRCNMNKYGMRIDFDMSLWPILYNYKQGGLDVTTFRSPTEKTFCITERDIAHFPNIVDAKPFYWPTNLPPVIQEPFRSMVAVVLPISKNAFTKSDNEVFRKLEKHPVFIYNKYKTLLKYILTDEDMYRNIAKLHINENARHQFGNGIDKEKSLVDIMAEHQAYRLTQFKNVLLNTPEFCDFIMGENGSKAINEIIAEFDLRNKKIDSKIAKKDYLISQYIATDKISERYKQIVVGVINHSTISFPSPENQLLSSYSRPTQKL